MLRFSLGILLLCASCKFNAVASEKPGECVTSVQCEAHKACVRGQCRSLCNDDSGCTAQVCDGGVCTPGARVDCAGVLGGKSKLDDCDRCGAISDPNTDTSACRVGITCGGVAGGQRANSACGNCPLTLFASDCYGLDCAGQRRATADAAARDCCDVCREPGEAKCEPSQCIAVAVAANTCGLNAKKFACGNDCLNVVDACGLCAGGATGKASCIVALSNENPLQVMRGVTRSTGAILTPTTTYTLNAASLVLLRFTLKSQPSLPWIQSVTLTWLDTSTPTMPVDVYAMTDWPSTDGNDNTVSQTILSTALSGLPVATSLGVTSNTREIKAFDETSVKPAFAKLIQAVQNAYDQGKSSIVFALVVPSGSSATVSALGPTLSYGTLESTVLTPTLKKRLDPSDLTLKDPVLTDNPDTLTAGALFFEFTDLGPATVIGARLLVPIVSASSVQSTVSVVVDQVEFARTAWTTPQVTWFDPRVLSTTRRVVDQTVTNTVVGVPVAKTGSRVYRVTAGSPSDTLVIAADGDNNNPTPRLHLARQKTSP